MSDNPSLDSVDSEYDMGSVQRDLNFLEDNPSLKDIMLANQPSPRMTSPFISLRPANPAMQALSSQKREAHNRSPVSFREGRRASDTSLTQVIILITMSIYSLSAFSHMHLCMASSCIYKFVHCFCQLLLYRDYFVMSLNILCKYHLNSSIL